MEYKMVDPNDLDLNYNWAEEQRKKAVDFFASKEHSLWYRAVGNDTAYEPATIYFEMTDEEKRILQQIQNNHPGEDLAFALQSEGYDKLEEEIAGEEGFWVHSIDFEHPVTRYQFSIQEISKYSFRVSEKEIVWVNIDDKDYVDLLERVIRERHTSFNRMELILPEVHKKIVSQLESSEEDHRKFGDNPYIVFMDELEQDVESICGAPVFSEELFSDNQDDDIHILFKTCGGVATVEKSTKVTGGNYNEMTGKDAVFLSFFTLKSIPSDKLMAILGVDYEEDLPSAVSERFYGQDSFEEFREFLVSSEVPFEYEENGYIV